MTTEVIEGSAVTVREEGTVTALPEDRRLGAIFALGRMSQDQFEGHVEEIKAGLERIRQLQRSLLSPGIDYAPIGGPGRTPTLLKPGAEKLASFASLVPTFTVHREEAPGYQGPTHPGYEGWVPTRITYTVTTLLHYQSADGPIVGSGTGVCSTGEVKYLYRDAKPVCPNCGKELRLSKDRPEWYCWAKQGGCGNTYPKDAIKAGGRVYNQEPHELENTVCKMAEKRSFTDAVIRALNASALFTQDIGDQEVYEDEERPARTTRKPKAGKADPPSSPPASGASSSAASPTAKPAAGSASDASPNTETDALQEGIDALGGWDDDPPKLADPMSYPVYEGTAGVDVDAKGRIIGRDAITTGTGARLMRLWLLPEDSEVRMEGVIPVSEYEAQSIGSYKADELVRIVGSWHKAGNRVVIVLTAIARGW